MAVTSIWPIKGRVDKVINYARNPEKTHDKERLSELHEIEGVVEYAKQASENGVAAIWNFANVDLSTLGLEAAVENVNLMDSLYTLTYYSRDGE